MQGVIIWVTMGQKLDPGSVGAVKGRKHRWGKGPRKTKPEKMGCDDEVLGGGITRA